MPPMGSAENCAKFCPTIALKNGGKTRTHFKKNYETSNIFTMQKYTQSSKNPLKETKILQDIVTL
jgi:hypothetical protein